MPNVNEVLAAARRTSWPGASLCATWVTNVFSNAGVGWFGGNACDQYNEYCDRPAKQAQPGMIVAVPSWPGSSMGKKYGHVGIYMGGGVVRHSISTGVSEMRLDAWVQLYGQTHEAKCGWMGRKALAGSNDANQQQSTGGFDLASMKTLAFGANGKQVGVLQSVLNGKYGCSIAVDDVFGNDTKYCVGLFQEKHGLTKDYVVGPATWAALLA